MAILEYVDREGELRPARAVAIKEPIPDATPVPLEERLAQVMKSQAALRAASEAGVAPRPLTPSFPLPHVAPTQWDDSLWAPRSKKARASIMRGGSLFPRKTKGEGGLKETGSEKAQELR